MNNSCKLWGGLAASSPGMFPLFLGRSSLMVGGAVDIVVVQQEDGSFKSSPWFVRFSKLHGVLNVNEKVVNISVNEVEPDFPMYMNHKGQAFFLREVHSEVHSVIRANTPTSEQLASLNLKEGRNKVTFSFSTAKLVTQPVEARIYLWKWNTRIVISDVDGTITRGESISEWTLYFLQMSDVRGQFMPMIGIDWSQTGVAHLFSAIQENGYQLLFLSARAISQACHTRQYLFNLKQDGKVLPDGPVVISPDGLIPALYREVIRRAPHEFKIKCLEALFPPDCNPFYAGFGNKDTDETSYLKVGIPNGKIFIINPRGEIAVNRCHGTKSYTSLHAVVNGMFPPYKLI